MSLFDVPQSRAPLLSRRHWLSTMSAGFGALAFAGITAEQAARGASQVAPHFTPRAKRVVFLFMRGAPSQMETFDYKPRLNADNGKPSPNKNMKLFGSQWKFARRGQSGLWISDLMPHTARVADDLCILNGMKTDHLNHPEASDQMHTGSFQFERPSLGSWVLYGLGTENQNLPGFVSIKPPVVLGGARYYGSAFLPPAYQGLPIGTMDVAMAKAKLSNTSHPSLTREAQRRQLDLLAAANRDFAAEQGDASGAIDGVIRSYESAFRMQQELPQLLDLKHETQATLDLYGAATGDSLDFGRQCLTARRLLEAGVRFVELTHDNWDHHAGVAKSMPSKCKQIDQPIAGLLTDLKQRGLLEDTLVVWGGEFGRSPDDRTSDGRGHNKDGFTMWLAGGGVRGGMAYGSTDEYGFRAVDGIVHTHDLHATILHQLGLDHEKLTYRYGGRDFRLTDVHGRVVREVIS
ncbi:MAG: DUF1501 domain-containing protein [Planctomycetia bacterium]|nr:DUF1501 domain-containing protein [Planctomycetia bacterium]